ncbi:MAG: hypothetical protein DMG06_16995 [Acidobacteria bacterium]|nr:MAG: hypothetical protein DMG06_16995 [Acidobacteriota bacterium]
MFAAGHPPAPPEGVKKFKTGSGGRGSRRASWSQDLLGDRSAGASPSQFFHTSPSKGEYFSFIGGAADGMDGSLENKLQAEL